MKRQWKIKCGFLVIYSVLMFMCVGCTGGKSGNKTETSLSESETVVENVVETKVETVTENKNESEKLAIETAILRKAAGKSYVSSEDQAFLDELAAYSEEQEEAEAEVQMMAEYASHIVVAAEILDGETAKLQMKVPCLAEILEDAIASMSEDDKKAENASELVKKKVREILAAGEFEWTDTEMTVSYTMTEQGVPKLIESKEYLDALYGGLLSRTESIMVQVNADATETEVAK